MTVVNPKSISGINSITTGSGSDNLLTIHTNDGTERVRVDSAGTTKVGSGVTLSPDGDMFATGVTTSNSGLIVGNGRVRVTGLSTITNNAQTIMAIDSADDNTAGLGGKIGFAALVNETTRTLAAVGGLKSIAGTGNFSGDLALYTRVSGQGNLNERLRIVSDGKVGIGTTNPSTTLDVNGVITGDGSGLTAVNTPSFSAYVTGNPSIDGNTNTTVVFNVEDYDTDGAYNTSTGVFTVPSGKAGKYHIDAYCGVDDIDDETYVRIIVQKNGTTLPGFRSQSHCSVNTRIETTGMSGTVTLAVGDEIRVQLFTNAAGTHQIENETCRFSMFRLAI